jgi:magnesium transporter
MRVSRKIGDRLKSLPRLVRKSPKKAGLAPGTLVHVGEQKAEHSEIALIHYDTEQLVEEARIDIDETDVYRDQPAVTWIDVHGLHDVRLVEKIGRHFNIHPLTLEDIVNTGHRPKAEDYDAYLFVILKMLTYDSQNGHVASEQVSLVLGNGFLLSFQERAGDVFNPVRERIRKGRSRIRTSSCDYLMYALMDAMVDGYFTVLERFGEKIEQLEVELLGEPTQQTLEQIHFLKRELIYSRRQVWPLREVLSTLMRDQSRLIDNANHVFLRDVYDHCVQVIDTIESLRDVLSGMLDLYLSTVSNRMNEVMKVLTIIATIFIPLTFIAGIYGMNFKFMPELEWRWSYPLLWLVLVVVFLLMIYWFKRRKWL